MHPIHNDMTVLYALIIHVRNERSWDHTKASNYLKKCFDDSELHALDNALVYDSSGELNSEYFEALDHVGEFLAAIFE